MQLIRRLNALAVAVCVACGEQTVAPETEARCGNGDIEAGFPSKGRCIKLRHGLV